MRRLSRHAVVALVAGVGVVIAALVVTGFALVHRGDEVASIDGHSVTRDELLFHVRRLEPQTTRALDEIWREKTTLILANERGLPVSIDHEDFLTEVAEENERRAAAIANGEIVYGVTEFSADEYYSHQLTEIRTALKQQLSARPNDPLWVTDAEIRRAFDADRSAWSAGATTYRYSKLVVRRPDDAVELQQRVVAADQLADIAAQDPHAELTTGTHDGGSAGVIAQDQNLAALLERLAPGEISAPVVGTGEITYYELDSETVDEGAAFAKYSRRIRQSLIEERFNDYLERRIATSDIQVDSEAVAAINAKDVQE